MDKIMPIQQIMNLLIQQQIKGQHGSITFSLANVSFPVVSKDIVGGILQEWFENWMIMNNIPFTKPSNPQTPPDFFIGNNEHLEIKAFNYNATPGFDVANFDAYTRALLTEPERLDSDHLIFGYIANGNSILIEDFWVKKIWEITGPSEKNYISSQVKQNVITNIRPKNWRGKGEVFSSRLEFVVALDKALTRFHPNRYKNWLAQIESAYKQQTGRNL